MLRNAEIGHALQEIYAGIVATHILLARLGEAVDCLANYPAAEVEDDAAYRRLVEAGDAVEDGGLAGSVGADQSRDVAAACAERQVVYRHDTAETHGEVLDLQYGLL